MINRVQWLLWVVWIISSVRYQSGNHAGADQTTMSHSFVTRIFWKLNQGVFITLCVHFVWQSKRYWECDNLFNERLESLYPFFVPFSLATWMLFLHPLFPFFTCPFRKEQAVVSLPTLSFFTCLCVRLCFVHTYVWALTLTYVWGEFAIWVDESDACWSAFSATDLL